MKNFSRYCYFYLTLILYAVEPKWIITSPYNNINWKEYKLYKANLHIHTTVSDGDSSPDEVIDRYKTLGYSILAITDHDKITWPWDTYGRSAKELKMIAIKGVEISKNVHHMNSYFNEYLPEKENEISEKKIIERISNENGLLVLNHPGRYNKSPTWYINLYSNYQHLIGIEIYNRNNLYPYDYILWDKILSKIIFTRPVWGFANDDTHILDRDSGYSWNTFILPSLTEEEVKKAMIDGRFFYIHSPSRNKTIPEIKNIIVNPHNGTISVEAINYQKIYWIGKDTKVIYTGNCIDLSKIKETKYYLRIEVYSQDGTLVGTQPFTIEKVNHSSQNTH